MRTVLHSPGKGHVRRRTSLVMLVVPSITETGVEVYFCDPRSPWQRGSNENTNGLLRQSFPKGKSLAGVTQAQLDEVARKLNDRPRQTLGFRTPAEQLTKLIDGLHTGAPER